MSGSLLVKSEYVWPTPVMPETTGPALLSFTRRIGGENSARWQPGDVDRIAEKRAQNPTAKSSSGADITANPMCPNPLHDGRSERFASNR